jgi:hypothetical protein
MSDEWDSLHYDLRYELDALRDKGKFLACKDETFAHAYLGHAEEIIRKKGNWEISTLSTIRELREAIKDPHAWRVFMQTLLLVTITNRSGVIPEVAQAGREFKKDQSNKGGRRWQDKTDELKTRNTKIFEHFKKTRFSARRFAELHAPKYGLKPTQIRAILSKMEVAG